MAGNSSDGHIATLGIMGWSVILNLTGARGVMARLPWEDVPQLSSMAKSHSERYSK